MLVVDASVVAPIVGDDGPDGKRLRSRIRGETLAAPDVLRVEVLSVLRRQLQSKEITRSQADAAVDDLVDLPVEIFANQPLLRRVWALRDNVTPYDACYVALAESLDCPLFTGDTRLARAPSIRCRVEVA